MQSVIQLLLKRKLLLISLLANACLLCISFYLLSELKDTYTNYRYFRALPIGSSQAETIKSPTATAPHSTIVLFGDSRIETWHPAPISTTYNFINAGVSGETTSEMKRRFKRDVLRFKPAYVIIQAGMNDLTAAVTKGIKDPALLTETMHTNMHYFISTLESQGIEVIVTSIIPNNHLSFVRKLFWFNTLSRQVNDANTKLKQTTELLGAHWFDLDPLYLDQKGEPVDELFFDTLHINNEGYKILNIKLSDYLDSLAPAQ